MRLSWSLILILMTAASGKAVPAKTPFDLSMDDFHRDLSVNTASVLVAAKEATESFKVLPSGMKKTFIFTGNILNTEPILPLFSAGMGKSATAHLIAAASMAYRDDGYRYAAFQAPV